mgnify:CR=1 FL=1
MKNFKKTELIDEVNTLDNSRKATQVELDSQLAEANNLAKIIGVLFLTSSLKTFSPILRQSSIITSFFSKVLRRESNAPNEFSDVSCFKNFPFGVNFDGGFVGLDDCLGGVDDFLVAVEFGDDFALDFDWWEWDFERRQ